MDEEEKMLFAVAFATALLKLRHARDNDESLTLTSGECSTLIEAYQVLQGGLDSA